MLGREIRLASYAISVVMTLVFSGIVSIITHLSLKKIDMVESLKSVE